jgi:KDO2-lipid IV(A) lauroyltransferase
VLNKQLAGYRAGAWALTALPASVGCLAGQGVGAVVGLLPDFDGRRAIVASHMSHVLGRPLSREEGRRLVVEVFANYGRYWAESLRLPSLSQSAVDAGVVTEGEANLDAALAHGRGVVIAAPHLGGWEWAARYLIGRGLHVAVAVEALEPPEVFEWFVGFRERLGMEVVPLGPGAAGAILRAVRAGGVTCLLADRLVGDAAGVEVEFFGERVMMPAGPVTMAVRAGAPLLAAAAYHGRAASSHTIVFRPLLELPTEGRLRDRVQAGTQMVAHELEQLIGHAPTQWHILQPNWPGDPKPRTRHRDSRSCDGRAEGRPDGAAAATGA